MRAIKEREKARKGSKRGEKSQFAKDERIWEEDKCRSTAKTQKCSSTEYTRTICAKERSGEEKGSGRGGKREDAKQRGRGMGEMKDGVNRYFVCCAVFFFFCASCR